MVYHLSKIRRAVTRSQPKLKHIESRKVIWGYTMYNNSKTAKAVRLALMLGATATAAIAAPAAFADDHEKVERVQVTGSRIKRTEMEGANPVQVITAQDIKTSKSQVSTT